MRRAIYGLFAGWTFALAVMLFCGTAFAQVPTSVQGAGNVRPIDCSGTITAGGAAQNLFTATANLRGFFIMNLDTTEMLCLAFNGTAVCSASGTYNLAPGSATSSGGSFSSPLGFGTNVAPSIVAATTGHKYSCTKW